MHNIFFSYLLFSQIWQKSVLSGALRFYLYKYEIKRFNSIINTHVFQDHLGLCTRLFTTFWRRLPLESHDTFILWQFCNIYFCNLNYFMDIKLTKRKHVKIHTFITKFHFVKIFEKYWLATVSWKYQVVIIDQFYDCQLLQWCIICSQGRSGQIS